MTWVNLMPGDGLPTLTELYKLYCLDEEAQRAIEERILEKYGIDATPITPREGEPEQ